MAAGGKNLDKGKKWKGEMKNWGNYIKKREKGLEKASFWEKEWFMKNGDVGKFFSKCTIYTPALHLIQVSLMKGSLDLLCSAHDYLGQKSCCVTSQAGFKLFFCLGVL